MKKTIMLLASLISFVYADDMSSSVAQNQALTNAAAAMAQDPNYQAKQQDDANKAAALAGVSTQANIFKSVKFVPSPSNQISDIQQSQTQTKLIFSNKVVSYPSVFSIENNKAKPLNSRVLSQNPYVIIN